MKTITEAISKLSSNRRLADFLFILWAGGAALLSYSLVYTLRKPFTAATFDGIEAFGFDYKVLVTIIQIAGYLIAKFIGIKLISELKRENRLKFILVSIAVAELSLVAFGALPTPYNMFAMFFNGLSLGCMWGVIFSFIEGRRTTDVLASLLGISIVISSGTAKSIGLFVMNTLNVSEFWMPALIGAFALPLLALLGYSLTRLPQPTAQDIEQKSSRVTLNGKQRKELFIDFMPFLVLLFVANLMLVVLRDIKEDFLVKIIDMNGQSVSDTISRGGTILQTARCMEFTTPEGQQKGAEICKKHGIDAIVVIGGDGSFKGAQKLAALGINTIGLPGTIDLDIACTDYTIGFDTAVNTAMEAIDKVRDTSTSHERCSIIEVMGRGAGHIALWCGLANGAEEILLPEKYDYDEQRLIDQVVNARKNGKQHYIIVNAEGIGHSQSMAKRIEEATGVETRATILGHMQRGGSPTCKDRVYATTMGAMAVDLLCEGKSNRVIGHKGGKFVDFDIDEALAMKKDVDEYMYEISKTLV